MPKVTVGIRVPMSLDVEVHDGETVSDAVENALSCLGVDIDGETECYSIDCDSLSNLRFDDTVHVCLNCGESQTDELNSDDLCENCAEEEGEDDE
jgi:hypothetical protein